MNEEYTQDDWKQTQTALICSLIYFGMINRDPEMVEVVEKLLPKIKKILETKE